MSRLTVTLGLALTLALVRTAWAGVGLIGSLSLGHPWTGYAADTIEAIGFAGIAAVALNLARREVREP